MKTLTLLAVILLPAPLALGQSTQPAAAGSTDAAMLQTIETEVKALAKNGTIEVLDSRTGKPLLLSFAAMHKTVTKTGDGTSFACVDFKDAAGRLYDVDTYVVPEGSGYKVAELVLHKVDGKDRIRATPGAAAPPADTAQKVKAALESWAARDAAANGGQLPFKDPRAGKQMSGKVELVHSGVSTTGDGLLYACVDVRSEGKLYDLDVYVRPAGDTYEVAEVLVHDVDGKDRLR